MGMLSNETLEKVKSEGVSVDGVEDATPKDVEQQDNSSVPEKSQDQQDGAAKTVDSSDSTEKYRREAFKQASEWKKKYEDLEGRFSKLESTYTDKLESLVGMMTPKQESSMTPQDKQSLVQLFQMGMQVPEIAEMMGLNKHKEIEKSLQSERETRLNLQFDGEFDSVAKQMSESYGLKPDEVKSELLEFMQNSEFYGRKSYSHGLIKEAAKSLYFDRISELKTRETNLKLIQEQKLKKESNSESPSKGKSGKGPNIESNMKDFLSRRVQEEGGLELD